LLTLPGELWNRIYRYALLEADEIQLDRNNHMQPGVVHACRHLREETVNIYCEENKFELLILDLRFEPHRTLDMEYRNALPLFAFRGKRLWQNFREWLQMYHERRVPFLPGKPTTNDSGALIFRWAAAKVVDSLHDLPWTRVVDVLEQMRSACNTMDGFTSV
jgi:hypothetical protein